MKKVKKAIIPAAGLGTRFLPATKTVPKEMLTIVDAPIILYVIEEALAAGIEDIILVQGRGKYAIEDFFDTSYELEDKLSRDGKSSLLSRVAAVRDRANIVSIRQKHALGLGHAVFCAKPIVGDEPFAVLLGDEITVGQEGSKNVTTLLTSSFAETGISTVAVMTVPETDVNKYGIVEASEIRPGFFKVENLIEKPKPSQTLSRLALPGRYVFDNKLMHYLAEAKPSVNGEIQLTDSMLTLCKHVGLHALTFDSQRYDAGDKLGYLIANIELALKHNDLELPLREYIKNLARRIS
jgi:UTP--glucose-1-phosphate uridylyltransferase